MKKIISTLIVLCLFVGAFGQQKKIAFLENPGWADTPPPVIGQPGLVKALRDRGDSVEMINPSAPLDFAHLATKDLVIIGRYASSSGYTQFLEWQTLDVPVISLTTWVIRPKTTPTTTSAGNQRLRWVNNFTINGTPAAAVPNIDTARITSALPIANSDQSYDSVFIGVTTDGAAFPFVKWYYDYINVGVSDFGPGLNTGKVLAVFGDDAPDTVKGKILMVRWAPNVETYAGAGIHANYRTYMNIGADATGSFNMEPYTDESLQLFLNETAYLMGNLSVGAKTVKSERVNVYPNPSSDGRFTIALGSQSKANVKIYSITGTQVYNKSFETTGTVNINSQLEKGIYVLVVEANGIKSTSKIVIR